MRFDTNLYGNIDEFREKIASSRQARCMPYHQAMLEVGSRRSTVRLRMIHNGYSSCDFMRLKQKLYLLGRCFGFKHVPSQQAANKATPRFKMRASAIERIAKHSF
jgi:hypothetical protein